MIICYLAGPVDYDDGTYQGWKDELIKLCSNNSGIGFFDPPGSFKFNHIDYKVARYIHDINMFALNRADVLVGSLRKSQHSIGTPIEFYHATINYKPMLIRTDMDDSVYMKYMESYSNVKFFNSVKNIYDELVSIRDKQNENVNASSLLALDRTLCSNNG